MKWLWIPAAMLLCGAAWADDRQNMAPQEPGEDQVVIGVGLICNTPEQLQRYVGLLTDGAETQRAMEAVNQEAKDARACGVAAIAFQSDKTVQIKNMRGKIVSLVRINIVAAFDGAQWRPMPGLVQYALIEPEGYQI